MNNRQNGRRRGRGGQQVRGGMPGAQDRGNRIDNRARGNAAQLLEKYKALARDAQMQGDRVNTEYYLQFADHHFRVLSENRARFEEQRPRRDDQDGDGDEFGDGQRGFDRNGQDADAWGDDEDRAPAPAAREPGEGEAERAARRPRGDDGRNGGRRNGNHEGNRNGNGNDVAPRIDVDRLPAAIAPAPVEASASEPTGDAPRPRRRAPRRPREEPTVEA